jgi:hypothetical protein
MTASYNCLPFGPINLRALEDAITQMESLLLAFPKANSDTFQAVDACGLLQQQVNLIVASLNEYICGLIAQQALIQPVLALVEVIENPAAAVTWINNYITTYLVPQLAVYEQYAAQVIALAASIESLLAAIAATESNIKNCHITIPPITVLPTFG